MISRTTVLRGINVTPSVYIGLAQQKNRRSLSQVEKDEGSKECQEIQYILLNILLGQKP